MLDKRNKKIGGVCAGFARYMEVDVILVRTIWLVVAVATGVGFLAYFAAWLIMPSDYGHGPAARRSPRGRRLPEARRYLLDFQNHDGMVGDLLLAFGV